jgi:predicted nucleic acid-binding protein
VILVDTSVWVDHLRRGSSRLRALLDAGEVVCHPMVIGEIALGQLSRRGEVLALLAELPVAVDVGHAEVRHMVDAHALAGSGIGWVDAHLLASALLGVTPIWTLDRPLATLARRLGIAANPQP